MSTPENMNTARPISDALKPPDPRIVALQSPETPSEAKELAFAGIVEEHYSSLLRFATRETRSASTAEDLTQEALLSAWRGIGGLRADGSLTGWLYRILKNKIIDKSVYDKRRPQIFDQDLTDLPAESFAVTYEDPSVIYEVEEAVQYIDSAIGQLEPKHKQALQWLIDGYGETEIARESGLPMGTIASRVHRARARAKPLIKAYLDPETSAAA